MLTSATCTPHPRPCPPAAWQHCALRELNVHGFGFRPLTVRTLAEAIQRGPGRLESLVLSRWAIPVGKLVDDHGKLTFGGGNGCEEDAVLVAHLLDAQPPPTSSAPPDEKPTATPRRATRTDEDKPSSLHRTSGSESASSGNGGGGGDGGVDGAEVDPVRACIVRSLDLSQIGTNLGSAGLAALAQVAAKGGLPRLTHVTLRDTSFKKSQLEVRAPTGP